MIKKLKEVFGKAGAVFREYPMVLLMAFLTSSSLILYASKDYSQRQESFVFVKWAFVFSLGISLMFALKILSQRIGKEILLQIAGLCFLGFYFFLLPKSEKHFTEVYAFLLIPTFLLSHLLVSFIGFWGKNRELNFWQYNKNLFINFFLTIVFTGVLTGGIMLAILAIDQLFDFDFNSHYYYYTFNFLSTFGSCFVFLLFNEKGLSYLEKNSDYPVVLKFFTQYILVPLLLIYSVILYFYSAKILLNWELPRGWVSYLILAYSVIGILALLLVYPLKGTSAKSWVKIFSMLFYYTLAPLIILLFVAIFTRILEYGYTEPRYFVLLLALWLLTVVIYFIFSLKQTIKFVPISLFIFGLFSLIFPYFNAFSVAKRSQQKELMTILNQNNLLENNTINFSKKVKSTVAEDIGDKFEFLAKRNCTDFLTSLLAASKSKIEIQKNIADGNFYNTSSVVKDQFKNITYHQSNSQKDSVSQNVTLVSKNFSFRISGYQYLFKAYNFKDNFYEFDKQMVEVDMSVNQFQSKFNLIFNGETINLIPDLQRIFQQYSPNGRLDVDQLSVTKKVDNYEFTILFDSLTLLNTVDKNPQFLINSDAVLILIKKK